MTEEIVPEDYEVLEIPLNATMTDVRVPLDCEIIVVAQCPIAVSAKINDTSRNGINLQLVRTFRMSVKRLYLTTTTTSSDPLILFVSKTVEVQAAPASGRVQLVDSIDVIYDARDIVESEEYNDTTNKATTQSKDTGVLTTAGYNKITGYVECDNDVTITVYASRDDGSNFVQVDTASHTGSGTVATSFSFEIVAAHMKVEFTNDGGDTTTTFDALVNLSTGA